MLRRGSRRVHWAPTALITYLAAGFVSFGVISPPEHCPEVTSDDLRSGAEAAAGWLIANQRPDGSYLYEYDRTDDTVADAYNVVRHSGVVMSLYMAGKYGLSDSFDSAERGLTWSLERLTSIDDWTAAGDPGAPSVGATALLVAGLVERRDQTGDPRYDHLLEAMGRFLAGQVEPSGAVSARFDMDARRPVAGNYSIYYTGEAYWALVQLQRLFPDGPWADAAPRVGAYIAGPRDDAEDMNHVRDHWAAYGVSETNATADTTHNRALTDNQIVYAQRQAAISGTAVRWLSQERGPWGTAVRGGPSELRGGGFGTIGESLTRWWRAARAEPRLDDLRDPLASRVRCLAAMTLDAQADDSDAAGSSDPARVRGAWFIDGVTRMDDQQHALSALLQSIDVVEGTTPAAPSRGDHERPSQWLWVVALVAAINPARVAGVLRSDGRWRPAQVSGAGIAAALAVLLLAAVAAGPLLDALDVSNPAYRVSAGALGGIAGIVGMLRRQRPREDSDSADASPVADALRIAATIASAVAVALTIGAAADRGIALVAMAVAVAAVLTAALAAVPRRSAGRVLLQLTERGAAALLVVTAVLLVVAGVMAV